MTFRLANTNDLPALETMYGEIADNLIKNNIKIYWSAYYPYADFEEFDIKNQNLYVLEENKNIIGAFCLTPSHEKANQISWKHQTENAFYISKLGVNIENLKQGVGSKLITHAKQIAKQNGAETLRLFVVDINTPAIKLYEKNGFERASGKTQEYLEFYDVTLTEFGYEFKL